MANAVLILLGVIFLAGGVIFMRAAKIMNSNCTAETVAVVQENYQEETPDEEDQVTYKYFPVFQYKIEGKEYTTKGPIGTISPRHQPGDQVTLKYDPADPNVIEEPGDSKSAMILGIICAAAGAGLLILGITV